IYEGVELAFELKVPFGLARNHQAACTNIQAQRQNVLVTHPKSLPLLHFLLISRDNVCAESSYTPPRCVRPRWPLRPEAPQPGAIPSKASHPWIPQRSDRSRSRTGTAPESATRNCHPVPFHGTENWPPSPCDIRCACCRDSRRPARA